MCCGDGCIRFSLGRQGTQSDCNRYNTAHIGIINELLKNKPYSMDTKVLDATDMSCFKDESFDAVLNMGPFYHLTNDVLRDKCLCESVRVLKKGGYLITAYIPRLYVNQMIVMSDDEFLDKELLCRIRDTGVLLHDDLKCFWTDTYYSSYEEMQALYLDNGLEITDRFSHDGLAPLFHTKVDQ